jgi:hypothetical protein
MKNLLLILSLFCFILACGNSNGPTAENTNVSPTDKQDMTDFYAFYNKFHSDTAYQMAHISFPLEGKPTQGADLVAGEKFYWQREDWAPHRPIDFETSPFERRIIPLGNDLVLEYIAHKKMNAGMMRRFAKLGDEWYLIYYEGMKSN